jgi:hypothetical protein
MSTIRPLLEEGAWEKAAKEGLTPVPKIKYKGREAIADEYHTELLFAGADKDIHTANLGILGEDNHISEYVYGHSYTDKDFIEWTLVPIKLHDYLRHSSFGKNKEEVYKV